MKPPRRERGAASDPRMIVDTVRVGARVYEQRYNRCGKERCRKCNPLKGVEHGVIGHGPYWYLCVTQNRKMRRIYIGRQLNTQLFVTADGRVDWAAIRAAKKERAARLAANREASDWRARS